MERQSKKMMEIMRNYYKKLQLENYPMNRALHEQQMEKVLSKLRNKVSEDQREDLDGLLTEKEIELVVLNGRAAGLDSIPQEIWKKLSKIYKSKSEAGVDGLDIIGALTKVYNDIRTYSMEEDSHFADRWLCPIYKKGDQTLPGKYRPIMVLNINYKILTKVLSTKISKVATTIIHQDQAGFMTGRRIKDQMELAHLMIKRCEEKEANGIVICLDQEKVYDKVLHQFLWTSLKRFKFLENFIKVIKSLYNDVNTRVILNGEISRPYRVKRGVQQGDSLLCLLFNITI